MGAVYPTGTGTYEKIKDRRAICNCFYRDPRGAAIKFYTEEGIWDLVCNDTPVFFIRDPILFSSFIHTQKRNPVTHLKVRFNDISIK